MYLKYERLLVKRFILIPVNHKNQHWLLIVIYPKRKVIALFDSVNSTSQTAQEIVKNISIFLEIYSTCHGLSFGLNKWKYVHEFDVPKPLNDIDCGVCTYANANEVSSITANEMNFSNIDFLEDVVLGSTIFQDVKITNDLPQLLHVEPKNEPKTLKNFYHKLCNLENGKSQSEIHDDIDDDLSELEDIRLDNNESKSSNVDELNQHEAEVDLVKFKTFVEINIVKLKDRPNALTPKMSKNICIDLESFIQ